MRGLVLGAWAGRPRLDRGAAGWRIVDAVRIRCSDVRMRAMFLTYLIVITSGLVFFVIIGLSHH